MKKYLVILLICIGSTNLFSQIVSVTPEAGIVFSGYRNDNIIHDDGIKIGGMTGVTADYRLTDALCARSGLMLDQKGNYFVMPLSDQFGTPLGELRSFLTKTYVGVPVLLRVKLYKELYFEGGGYVSYLIRSKIVDINDFNDKNDTTVRHIENLGSLKFSDRMNKGLYAALGVSIPLFGTQGLQVSVKYDYPLVFNRSREKYYAFCLSVGYRFKIRD